MESARGDEVPPAQSDDGRRGWRSETKRVPTTRGRGLPWRGAGGMPELVESVQSKRAKSVLRHLTAATATGNVAVVQAWAAMEDWEDDDVRHTPLCTAAGHCSWSPLPACQPFAESRLAGSLASLARAVAHGCGAPPGCA